MSSDRILLTVPAKPEFAYTVRMMAGQLGSVIGMSVDESDDVKLAAEEAFVYACDTSVACADVELEFMLQAGALALRVPLAGSGIATNEESERRAAYATFILQAICDSFELGSDENGSYLRLTKRVGALDADAL